MAENTREHAPVSAALAEAQNILKAAERKAQSILEQAEADSQAIRQEAYEKGLQLGKQAVVDHAITAFKEQSEIKVQLESAAAQLTYDILEHIFSLKDPRILNPISEIATKLLGTLPTGGSIEIAFNSSHVDTLDVIRPDLEELSRGSKLTYKTSEEVPESVIIVRTDFGEIQVSLKEFFEEITKQMKLLPAQ